MFNEGQWRSSKTNDIIKDDKGNITEVLKKKNQEGLSKAHYDSPELSDFYNGKMIKYFPKHFNDLS